MVVALNGDDDNDDGSVVVSLSFISVVVSCWTAFCDESAVAGLVVSCVATVALTDAWEA